MYISYVTHETGRLKFRSDLIHIIKFKDDVNTAVSYTSTINWLQSIVNVKLHLRLPHLI